MIMWLYAWVLIHVGLIYWGKILWYPNTSTLAGFMPHMPLTRLFLTPITGSLYRPLLRLLTSARILLWSLGLGRERPNVVPIVFRSDDDLLNPLPISILTLVRANYSLQRNSGMFGNNAKRRALQSRRMRPSLPHLRHLGLWPTTETRILYLLPSKPSSHSRRGYLFFPLLPEGSSRFCRSSSKDLLPPVLHCAHTEWCFQFHHCTLNPSRRPHHYWSAEVTSVPELCIFDGRAGIPQCCVVLRTWKFQYWVRQ